MEVTIIDDSIRVDLSTLVAAEQDFMRALHDLQAELDRLDSELRAHLDQWSGDAKAAYQTAHARWRAAAADMAASLEWLQGVIRIARGNYHGARSANLRMWQASR